MGKVILNSPDEYYIAYPAQTLANHNRIERIDHTAV
jgi:hypothetical protein